METVLRNPLILSLCSLIFLNQQLTRFFYDCYQGVQPFQRSHRVSDQLFYRYFCTTIKSKFILYTYTKYFHFFAQICKCKTILVNVLANTFIVTFFMISYHTILTKPINYSHETFFNMVSLILFSY